MNTNSLWRMTHLPRLGAIFVLVTMLVALPAALAQDELTEPIDTDRFEKVNAGLLTFAEEQGFGPTELRAAPQALEVGLAARSAVPQASARALPAAPEAASASAPAAATDKLTSLGVSSSEYVVSGATVLIDALATDDGNALLADLQRLGLQRGSVYGQVVSGYMPLSALWNMQGLDSLDMAMPSLRKTNVGSVENEAVQAMLVDEVIADFGLDGTGLTIGILSDSFDCSVFGGAPGVPNPTTYAQDIASGDLPPGIVILADEPCGVDEGRAMAQLIHDVVPGADLVFHTAFAGLADFAQGIIDLADAGADIIVDDVIYFAEPIFADGIIAQAADEVTARGIPYFSSAGNNALNGYESAFVNSGQFLGPYLLHDFDPGPGIDVFQTVTLAADGGLFIPSFQWTDAYASTNPASPGASSDLDMLVFENGTFLPDLSGLSINIGDDPLELFGIINNGLTPLNLEIAIGLFEGAEPELMRYVDFGGVTAIEYAFDSVAGTVSPNAAPTMYGHSNAGGRTGNAEFDDEAIGAVAVGASFFGTTPAFGTNPPLLNAFSSYGPTPIYFDIFGQPYPAPIVEARPQITAPDGTNTSFFFQDTARDEDTNPNFFGTSAAAPHAAAVTALMLEANPTLTPRDIVEKLQFSAIDIVGTNDVGGGDAYNVNVPLPVGPDEASGAGLIQADVAVKLSLTSPELVCNGQTATIFVEEGIIVGGPMNGQVYHGILRGGNQADVIVGTNADDMIRGSNNNDVICGFAGDDTLQGENGFDVLLGGDGDDTLNGGNGNDTLVGAAGDDELIGNNGDDNLSGGDGDDIISGGTGMDTIDGGPGADEIAGGASNDMINGGPGVDVIDAGGGSDTVSGGLDGDTINGGQGQDTLSGDDGEDMIFGDDGEDTLFGGNGGDMLSGDQGQDNLFGEAGDDVIFGGTGNDNIDGGEGNDTCQSMNGANPANTINCES